MNWLQKIAQSLPPTYTGVGHGYRWDEENRKYVEHWQHADREPVILWWYEDGFISEEYRTKDNTAHWLAEDTPGLGRVETGTNRGSVAFNTDDPRLKKDILNALVDKYPGVKFGVYALGGPYTLQQYWQMIEGGRV